MFVTSRFLNWNIQKHLLTVALCIAENPKNYALRNLANMEFLNKSYHKVFPNLLNFQILLKVCQGTEFLLKAATFWKFLLNLLNFVRNVVRIVQLRKCFSGFCVLCYKLLYKTSFDNFFALVKCHIYILLVCYLIFDFIMCYGFSLCSAK